MRPFTRKPIPVLFLDLDGTVRKGKDELGRFVHGPEDVDVYPEAAARIARAKEMGFRVVAITNQGGIAMGLANAPAMLAASARTNDLCMGMFDVMEICPHHPVADDPELSSCLCRKPKIGMIVSAMAKLRALHPGEFYPLELCLLVGDRPEDKACADAAGIRFQDAAEWRAQQRQVPDLQ